MRQSAGQRFFQSRFIRRWGLAKDGERSRDAPVIIAVTLFGSHVAVRCTLICARYLLWVMSPEGQRSVYICDNAIIGGPVMAYDSICCAAECFSQIFAKKYFAAVGIIRFDLCAPLPWKVDCSSLSN